MEAMRLCHLLTEQKNKQLTREQSPAVADVFPGIPAKCQAGWSWFCFIEIPGQKTLVVAINTKGFEYLDGAVEPFEESPYHIEAVIASLHAAAPSFEKTNWPRLLSLYDLLPKMNPSPVVSLNRAIVLSMVQGPRSSYKRHPKHTRHSFTSWEALSFCRHPWWIVQPAFRTILKPAVILKKLSHLHNRHLKKIY